MAALNLLDVSYFAVTALGWIILAALAIFACAFVYTYWLAREDEERLDRSFAHPSNVTLIDERPFDFERDA